MGRVMPVMSTSWKASDPRTFGGDLAGDSDDRNAVKHGGRQAGDEVGGSGTGGGHADAYSSGGAGIPIGHVGGALLVADQDVVDGGEFAEGVVDRQDGATGIAEDGAGAFAGQGGPEDFGSSELGVLVGHLYLHDGQLIAGSFR